jgi:hypothetical protein
VRRTSLLGCKNNCLEITTADTDDDRVAVRNFLAQYIDGIAPNAVPPLENEGLYRPLVSNRRASECGSAT